MKNYENTALLAHKRAFDKRRREAAIAKRQEVTKAAFSKLTGAK